MVEQMNESVEQNLSSEVDALMGDTDFGNFDVDGIKGVESWVGNYISEDEWENKPYIKDLSLDWKKKQYLKYGDNIESAEKMINDWFLSLNLDVVFWLDAKLKSQRRLLWLKKDLRDIQKDIVRWKYSIAIQDRSSSKIKLRSEDPYNTTPWYTYLAVRKVGDEEWWKQIMIGFNQFTNPPIAYIEYDGVSSPSFSQSGWSMLTALWWKSLKYDRNKTEY